MRLMIILSEFIVKKKELRENRDSAGCEEFFDCENFSE
jgi:hypothetical protein